MLSTIQAVLFDMDGVLTDNACYHKRAWLSCAHEALGFQIADDDPRIYAGLNHEVLELLTGRKPGFEEALHFHYLKEGRYRKLAQGQLSIVQGLIPYLDNLLSRNIPTALVTNADSLNVAFVLGELGLEDRFTVRVGGEDVQRGKPDPQGYLLAASRLGVDPRKCLIHEDSVAGVRAGKAAQAGVAALMTTMPAEALYAAGATWVISNFQDWLIQIAP